MATPNPRPEDNLMPSPMTPLYPLTPSFSEQSLDTDSQSPLTPATLDILLEPADMAIPGTDESEEEDEDLFGERDETIRPNPIELARLTGGDAPEYTPETQDDDMFPSTAAPLDGDTRTASRVPLPRAPSPGLERTIPGPPAGWKSTLQTNNEALARPLPALELGNVDPYGACAPSAPVAGRRFSARTVSGSHPLRVKGRTVSGAMQYAMHRANAVQQHAPLPTARAMEPRPPLGQSAIGLEEVSTVQQDEEIWMSYVRRQLAALFPDFFDPNEHSQPLEGPGSSIMARARQSEPRGSHGAETDEVHGSLGHPMGGEQGNGWNVIQDRGHRRPWMANSRVPSVTNVKDEIGGMKDEIERLREVVSGLASGMRGDILGSSPVVDEHCKRAEERVTEPRSSIDQYGIPQAKVKVNEKDLVIPMTPAAMALIKSIDVLVHGQDRSVDEVLNDDNLQALTSSIQERLML